MSIPGTKTEGQNELQGDDDTGCQRHMRYAQMIMIESHKQQATQPKAERSENPAAEFLRPMAHSSIERQKKQFLCWGVKRFEKSEIDEGRNGRQSKRRSYSH